MQNFKDSLWFGNVYNNDSWDTWDANSKPMLLEKAVAKAAKIEAEHESVSLKADVAAEIDAIVEEAKAKIVGR